MGSLPDLEVLHVHVDERRAAGAFSDPEYILTYVAAGRCDYRIEDRGYLVEPGHLVLMPPHLPHLLVPREGAVLHRVVHITLGAGGDWIEACPEVALLRGERRQRVARWMREMQGDWDRGEAGHPGLAAGLAVAVLRELARCGGGERATPSRGGGWPVLERALAVMHRRYGEPIGVAEIAREAGVSAAHLARLFTAHAGRGPARFLQDIRLQHAQELLHRGGLGCGEIAARCGFGSLPAFSRSFKQRLGVAPTAWLARLRQSVEHAGAPFQPWRG